MYSIFTYTWVIYGVNVGKYSSTMEHMGYIYVLHFEILAAVFHNPRQSITVEKSDLLAAHVSTLSQHFMAGHTSGIGVNPNKGLYINMWPRKDCLQSGRNILRQNKVSETRTGSRGKFAQHKASRSRARGHCLYLFGNIKHENPSDTLPSFPEEFPGPRLPLPLPRHGFSSAVGWCRRYNQRRDVA